MSKSSKKRPPPSVEQTSQEVRSKASLSFLVWMRNKRPVLAFVVLFALLMGLFYGITFIDVMELKILPAYMRVNATLSTEILNVFGEDANTYGTSIRSKRYSVDIRHGCDAIEPSALFLAAVLAFPAPLRSKIPGLIIGTLVLAIINLTRIVTLFYTGIYFPKWFQTVHVDVWQPVFILLSLTLWVLWAWWATKDPNRQKQPEMATSSNGT